MEVLSAPLSTTISAFFFVTLIPIFAFILALVAAAVVVVVAFAFVFIFAFVFVFVVVIVAVLLFVLRGGMRGSTTCREESIFKGKLRLGPNFLKWRDRMVGASRAER